MAICMLPLPILTDYFLQLPVHIMGRLTKGEFTNSVTSPLIDCSLFRRGLFYHANKRNFGIAE